MALSPVALLLGLAALPVPGQAQPARGTVAGGTDGLPASAYRTGVPEVMTPPPEPAAPAIAPLFRRAYAAQGSPRLMLFWNRAITDEVATPYQRETETHSSTSWGAQAGSSGHTAIRPDGWGGRDIHSQRHSSASGGSTTTTRTTEALRRADGGQYAPVRDEDGWAFEDAFHAAFAEAGVRLVDRAMTVRGQARDAGREAPNLQAVEAQAMASHADYVVEVLPGRDAGGPLFRVSVKAVRSGRVVASFTSAGLPPAPASPVFVPVPGRGYQEAVPVVGPAGRGHQLARETMERLAAAWGRR